VRPFRFGVIAENFSTAERWLDLSRRAEALGFDTLLIRDHFVEEPFGHQFAPFSALAAAAMVTSTLRLGTLVIDNDYRHPAVLAKEVATLDLLSGGRFELGIGAGWLKAEYERTGIPFDRPGIRIDRLEESITILKEQLRGESVSFEGQHYQVDGLTSFPLSQQQPHPPILIGGGSPRILRLAGREGDIVGILTTSVGTGVVVDDPRLRSASAVEERLSWVREGAGDRYPEIELSLVPTIVITPDRPAAIERVIADHGWSDVTPADVRDMPAIFVGTLDEIADQMLERRENLGFSYFVVTDDLMDEVAPLVQRLRGT
jgi:probable F420-dependent oxidoreductase